MSPRCLICGYYGFGNFGDEAVLAGILQQLPPSAEVSVLSANVAATEALHGVHAVPRYALGAVLETMRACDVFVSGGGSLFQDATSARSVVYYWSLVELAHRLGKPAVIWAQGLGPLTRPLSRMLTRQAFRRAKLITLRDEVSITLARELGATKPISLVADPALGLKAQIHEPLIRPATPPQLMVCIRSWRGWWTSSSERRFAEQVERLNARVLWMALSLEDKALSQRLGHQPEVIVPSSPGEALAVLAQSDLVLGMRLHALILAAAGGAPSVGIAYDPKVCAFAASVGQPWVDDLNAVESALFDAWERRDELRQTVLVRRDELLVRTAEAALRLSTVLTGEK